MGLLYLFIFESLDIIIQHNNRNILRKHIYKFFKRNIVLIGIMKTPKLLSYLINIMKKQARKGINEMMEREATR
jgi:hypothetical protein